MEQNVKYYFSGLFILFLNQELDLNNPKTFRNLAKPMGAQTDDRLTQYKKRYKDWEDPNGKNLREKITGDSYVTYKLQ